MSEEQGFVQQLLDHGDDDDTRLIYCDWLDEHGDPRGAYLRLEVELAGLQEEDDRYAETEARLRETRTNIDPEWISKAGKRFDVILHGYQPDSKIATIKVLRELNGMGLYQAKCLSETLPCCVAVELPRSDAESWRERLRSVLGRLVDVELAATSFSRSCYGIHLGSPLPNDAAGVRKALVEVLQVDPTLAAQVSWRHPVLVRGSLLLREAQALLAKLSPLQPFHLCRPISGLVWPLPGPGSYQPDYRADLHGYKDEDERFVMAVVARLGVLAENSIHELRQHLPLTLTHAGLVHDTTALWVWRRFRGRADVHVTQVGGTADPGPAS
jgi:uncharacterized protein (TIGR02996 family)